LPGTTPTEFFNYYWFIFHGAKEPPFPPFSETSRHAKPGGGLKFFDSLDQSVIIPTRFCDTGEMKSKSDLFHISGGVPQSAKRMLRLLLQRHPSLVELPASAKYSMTTHLTRLTSAFEAVEIGKLEKNRLSCRDNRRWKKKKAK
jgi:hypothetical protein